MTVPYSPLAIANEFILLGAHQGGIEHMKLQKLVYYAYGWWLATRSSPDEPPLIKEGPQIWRYGPVFSGLYEALKIFGRKPIDEPQSISPFCEPDLIGDDKKAKKLVSWIWKKYGHLSSFDLSEMTHRLGTSWERTAKENNYRVPFHTVISDQYILDEFTQELNAASA